MRQPTHFNPYFTGALLLASLGLSACGGGGGGDEGGSSANADVVQTSPSTTPAATTEGLQALSISYDNDLASVYTLNIDVMLNELNGKIAYLSVCDNRTAQGDLSLVDYDQCLVKSSLNNGLAQIDLGVANHWSSLIAVVWVMEEGSVSTSYTYQHQGESEAVWLIPSSI